MLVLLACRPEPSGGIVAATVPAVQTPEVSAPWFAPAGHEPLGLRGSQPEWPMDVIEPGAVLYHEGRFHLFFNTFTDWPGKTLIWHATSETGREWIAGSRPLLAADEQPFPGFTFFVSSAIVLEDGTWLLFLYTLDEGRDGAKGGILVASAPDPAGPWLLDPNYVIAPGPEGSWDGARVAEPMVLHAQDQFWMYYSGADTDRLYAVRQIGLATSRDGWVWQKWAGVGQPPVPFDQIDQTGIPVFGPGASGNWDSGRVFMPRVLRFGEAFVMLYKSNIKVGRGEGFGLAKSSNGMDWVRSPQNPIIDEKTYEQGWQRMGIANWFQSDEDFILLLEILEREGGGYHHGNSPYYSNLYALVHTGPLEAFLP